MRLIPQLRINTSKEGKIMEAKCLWGNSILPPAHSWKPILIAAPPRTPLVPLRWSDDVEAAFRWTSGTASIDAGGRPWIIARCQNLAPAKTWWWPHPEKEVHISGSITIHFWSLHYTAECLWVLHAVYPSICMHERTLEPLDGLSFNLISKI